MSKLTKEHLKKVEACSPLLPPPGPDVVEELLGHIYALEAEIKAESAAAVEAEHIRCLQVVERQIDIFTGPTKGWLDSPHAVFSAIAVNMLTTRAAVENEAVND